MKRYLMIFLVFVAVLALLMSWASIPSAQAAGKPATATPTRTSTPSGPTPTSGPVLTGTYYVDCSAAVNGDGSQSSPWNSLSSVNAPVFGPGASVLFKRGVTCNGMLTPKGSGTSVAPITLGDYGTGALPILNGGSNLAVIKLFDQQGWKLQNLETTGGTRYGIYISATSGATLTYFRLTNLNVHNVTGTTPDNKFNGLVLIGDANAALNDIVIDNVTAHDTGMWQGIGVWGGCCYNPAARSQNVTIRNSTAYNTGGEGIVAHGSNNALIEYSVSYNTGSFTGTTVGTPNGIWVWDTTNSVIQFTEAYTAHSPGVDGGAYDIDYYSGNVTVQYNYAHDNDQYCASVFGADSTVTTNAVIRYNVCSNNLRVSENKSEADIYVTTWTRGTINGLQVYNNTIYRNPVADSPESGTFLTKADMAGTNFIKNNIIYSASPNMLWIARGYSGPPTLDNNLWWYTGAATMRWNYVGQVFSTFAAYQSGSGQDAHGMFVNPMLNDPTYHAVGMPVTAFTLQAGSPAINAGTNVCTGISGCSMGTRDFFGNAIPQGGVYDIGAYEAP